MTDELRKPCALCGTRAEDMLTDDSCMACERDRLAAELREVSEWGERQLDLVKQHRDEAGSLEAEVARLAAENARLAEMIRSLRADLFNAESNAAYVDRMYSGTTEEQEVIYRAREDEQRAEWDAETERMIAREALTRKEG